MKNSRYKFRALNNGQWWYSDDEAYLLKEYDGELWLVEDTQFYLSDSPRYAKIGKAIQFTGLCDSEGTEIFEGDIFMNGESVRIIEINGGNTHAITPDRKQAILLSFIVGEKKNTVIGNIDENPDLLK